MNEQKQILERYIKTKLSDKKALSITRLEKLRDGWESDNYIITVTDDESRSHTDWVWRLYTGIGSQKKAVREFSSMNKLLAAGYPVPRVFFVETEHSPFDRPFIIMELFPGEVMWKMIDVAPADMQAQLIDRFCQLFVQLHALDWKHFDDSVPDNDPFFFIKRWLSEACWVLQNFPEVDASAFLDWVDTRQALFACERPSPAHQDFHPGNILVGADGSAAVIDWTSFAVTDFRFDLAWTLMLAHAYGWSGLRDLILQGYQDRARKSVEHIEVFEAIACARRLLDLTISLTHGAQIMGMNAQAVEAMRASMEAHRRVYNLFIRHTGLQIELFDNLFGKSE